MSVLTYTALVNELSSYLERRDTEFFAVIPTLVRNAELRITTDLKDLTTQELVQGTLFAGTSYIAKPSLWRETVSIGIILPDQSLSRLFPRTFEFCRDAYPASSTSGVPEYYSDSNIDYIFIAPRSSIQYPYELVYQSAVAPLSANQQQNYITRRFPNLLLYACLLEAVIWTKESDRLQELEAVYAAALQAGKNEQARRDVNRTISGVS